MILYIVLWISNLVLVFLNKRSKLISICTYVLLGILFVSNPGLSGDAKLYKHYFEKQDFLISEFELGYALFEKIIYCCGIHTYNGLLISLFLVSTVFFWIGLRKYDYSYHYLFAIIMPFIFPTYATAIRFFVASSIIVAAIRFLNEKKYCLFFILVICAGSFHLISMFYLIFILCRKKIEYTANDNRKTIFRFTMFFSVLLFVFSVISKTNLLILSIVKIISLVFTIGMNKIQAYTATFTNFGGFIFIPAYFTGLLTSIYIHKMFLKKNIYFPNHNEIISNNSIDIQNLTTINYYINLIIGIIIPFLAFNLIFYRLLIIGHISNALILGIQKSKQNLKKDITINKSAQVNILFLLSCLTWFIPEIIGINDITIKGLFDTLILFGQNR